jgi:biuret amidohydrolase
VAEFPVIPHKLALINTDLQNVFVEGTPLAPPDGLQIVGRLNRLAETCRRLNVLVIHTAHVTRPDGANVGVLGDFFPPVRAGMIAAGGHPAALHASLRVEPGDLVVTKPRFGAFHASDLDMILRARGIDTVIIGGIATNVCAESTAREANTRDYKVFFLSDGTSTTDMGGVPREVLQRATCATLAFGFAQVLTVEEMIAKLNEAARL